MFVVMSKCLALELRSDVCVLVWLCTMRTSFSVFLDILPLLLLSGREVEQEIEKDKERGFNIQQMSPAGSEPGMLQFCGMHNAIEVMTCCMILTHLQRVL